MQPFSEKQLEFIANATRKFNLAHGAVRTGKTICTIVSFLHQAYNCPDDKIYIIGHTFDTVKRNIVDAILGSPELSIFRPFSSWSGKKLTFKDKKITVLGAKDEGAIGAIQGDTYSLVLCDEMTLYPDSIIEMIKSRLSRPYSKLYATMNPKHPTHILKQWIDEAEKGDPNYYSLHFRLEDNPYVDQDYKDMLYKNPSGLFYKRNVLGLWCLAEGAIFDFFDRSVHLTNRPPCADYFIASIDYGTVNPFVCLIIGVYTGKHTQTGKQLWVENEYYWNPAKTHRQKTNTEFVNDIQQFIEPYGVKQLYIDPSAASFKLELQKRGIHCIDAYNDVEDGIFIMTDAMAKGTLKVHVDCKNTIREIESYVWDPKKAEKGWDEPLKKDDHAMDALRYAIATHKVAEYKPFSAEKHLKNWNSRFGEKNF
jgi:PBSX family phage terminase large subunit